MSAMYPVCLHYFGDCPTCDSEVIMWNATDDCIYSSTDCFRNAVSDSLPTLLDAYYEVGRLFRPDVVIYLWHSLPICCKDPSKYYRNSGDGMRYGITEEEYRVLQEYDEFMRKGDTDDDKGNIYAMVASCEGDKDHTDLYNAFAYLDTLPEQAIARHAKFASDMELFSFLMCFQYYPSKGCKEAVEELCRRHYEVCDYDYRTYPQFIQNLYYRYGR